MRDERRKKEASKVKQTTRQSNTTHPRQSLFLRKMSCLRYMYMYMQGSAGVRRILKQLGHDIRDIFRTPISGVIIMWTKNKESHVRWLVYTVHTLLLYCISRRDAGHSQLLLVGRLVCLRQPWLSYSRIVHAHTELMVSLFIRCTMRCEIWAQPAELPS